MRVIGSTTLSNLVSLGSLTYAKWVTRLLRHAKRMYTTSMFMERPFRVAMYPILLRLAPVTHVRYSLYGGRIARGIKAAAVEVSMLANPGNRHRMLLA